MCVYVSVCVYLRSRRRFLASVHLLSYWNQHLRHVGAQDGEVGREMILIYLLSPSLSPSVVVASVSVALNEFSPLFEAAFIKALMIRSIIISVGMSFIQCTFGFFVLLLSGVTINLNCYATAINLFTAFSLSHLPLCLMIPAH